MSTLVITHNAVDITNLITTDTASILDAINSERDSFNFQVEKTPEVTFEPLLNKEVIVTLDGVRIFGGTLITYSSQAIEPPSLTYTVECSDFTHSADSELITERFIDQTGEYIIGYLFDNYLASFTYTNIVFPATVARVSFNRLTMTQCLDKLARLGNYHWYIDYNKDLHFFPKNTEAAPFNLTDTSDNYIVSSLVIRKDIAQLRNKILVEGGEIPTNERTALATGDGETTEFTTKFKFAELPIVLVDGVARTVGTEHIDTTGFYCYWSFQQKYVRFDSANIPAAPSSGTTNIEMTGKPLVPIVAKVPLPSSINKFGLVEFAITDQTIKNQDLAIERAIAELEAWADENAEAMFDTYTAGLRSGQIINITNTMHGVSEDFVIQRATFVPYPNDSEKAGVWSIELASTATMTLIQLLQKMLLNEKLEDDELESLLTYLTFEENAVASDILESVTAKTEPYNWDAVGTDWDYFKWA